MQWEEKQTPLFMLRFPQLLRNLPQSTKAIWSVWDTSRVLSSKIEKYVAYFTSLE